MPYAATPVRRPWDACLARRLVAPLVNTWVTPNHVTTLRLSVGLAAAAAFTPGSYGWSNIAALLLIFSNLLDHADGELARLCGTSTRFGHVYDLASDAVVTILLFIAIGVGVAKKPDVAAGSASAALGLLAGTAIALIFYLRMRIETLLGKDGIQQASLGGFETEDVLYFLPLATLCNALAPLLLMASICAPLFAAWVTFDYQRVLRRDNRVSAGIPG